MTAAVTLLAGLARAGRVEHLEDFGVSAALRLAQARLAENSVAEADTDLHAPDTDGVEIIQA